MSNFQSIEVVDRGSETQPQVFDKLNILPFNPFCHEHDEVKPQLLYTKCALKHQDLQMPNVNKYE